MREAELQPGRLGACCDVCRVRHLTLPSHLQRPLFTVLLTAARKTPGTKACSTRLFLPQRSAPPRCAKGASSSSLNPQNQLCLQLILFMSNKCPHRRSASRSRSPERRLRINTTVRFAYRRPTARRLRTFRKAFYWHRALGALDSRPIWTWPTERLCDSGPRVGALRRWRGLMSNVRCFKWIRMQHDHFQIENLFESGDLIELHPRSMPNEDG